MLGDPCAAASPHPSFDGCGDRFRAPGLLRFWRIATGAGSMVRAIASTRGQFGLNLDGNVGKGQSNKLEDVQLVQFGFYCLSKDSGASKTPEQQAIYASVKLGSAFSGTPTDPLCIAIATHQRAKGGTQDGVVSVLPNGFTTYGSGHYRTFAYLLASIYVVTSDTWPRIDKHPACPAALRAVIKDKCAKLL
jgi:hypothetical protein